MSQATLLKEISHTAKAEINDELTAPVMTPSPSTINSNKPINRLSNRSTAEQQHSALPTISTLLQQYPLTPSLNTDIAQHRAEINNIISGKDSRLLVVVGPCSIHDTRAALEYGQLLSRLSAELHHKLKIVMRCYVEKPRTTIGWKGLVYDPLLNNTHDVTLGLSRSRRLMIQLSELNLPLATESLSTILMGYFKDLIGWTAIGARTSESQLHREMASDLDCPVGFKNGTDGSADAAIQSIQSCAAKHSYPSLSHHGYPCIKHTKGNPSGHLVLRGGKSGTNYDEAQITHYAKALAANHIQQGIMVDCSHGNSHKDHRNQHKVLQEVMQQIRQPSSPIIGVMLESFLNEGQQPLSNPEDLKYGVSITDACIGWDETENILRELAHSLPRA